MKDYAKRGEDICNSMPPGGQGLNKQHPQVMKLMNQQKQLILSMDLFLGEELMHVMRGMERTQSSARLFWAQKTVSCPGGNPGARVAIRLPDAIGGANQHWFEDQSRNRARSLPVFERGRHPRGRRWPFPQGRRTKKRPANAGAAARPFDASGSARSVFRSSAGPRCALICPSLAYILRIYVQTTLHFSDRSGLGE